MICKYCDNELGPLHYHLYNCWGNQSPVQTLATMIEDAIKRGVTLIRDMPHCSFCGVRGTWTDDEPVFEHHKDTCLITKYNNYLRDE